MGAKKNNLAGKTADLSFEETVGRL